jgi:hypothetical protein
MGNLVTSLEHANPAQVLLSAAHRKGIPPAKIKDSDIYLGVLDSESDFQVCPRIFMCLVLFFRFHKACSSLSCNFR